MATPIQAESTLFNLHTAQVSVSYILDVFGGNRRQVENLQALADQQRFQLEAAYLTLTWNVVAAAVQEASLRAQINAIEEVVRIQTTLLALLQRQYRLGDVAWLTLQRRRLRWRRRRPVCRHVWCGNDLTCAPQRSNCMRVGGSRCGDREYAAANHLECKYRELSNTAW